MKRAFLSLLILGLPLGVAAQNILAAIVGLALIVSVTASPDGRARFSRATKSPMFICASAFLATFFIASILSPFSGLPEFARFIAGHFFWWLAPVLLSACCFLDGPMSRRHFRLLAVVSAFWALLALSQNFYGWELSGVNIISGSHRPKALYSHPLTFAYAALLLWPLAVAMVLKRPRLKEGWVLFVAILICLWLTRSRTVQAIAVLVLGFNVFFVARQRTRLVAGAVFAVLMAVVVTTPNSVRTKFVAMMNSSSYQQAYPIDRMVFWHAHWEMWKDRPLFGYGPGYAPEVRDQAYASIGMADFEKKYMAHNMFLQVATNAGLVGLLFFVGWFLLVIRRAQAPPDADGMDLLLGSVLVQTWVAFGLASLTQNAFQDAEVRYAITLLASASLLFHNRFSSTPHPLLVGQ